MKPKIYTSQKLASILRQMADHVENGDSFDGEIEYHISDEGPDAFEVTASFRIGNSEGQGSCILIGENITQP